MKTTNNKPMSDVMQANLGLLPLIMNNVPQAVFWKDRNLVYLGCNQAFADDAGFPSPEDVIGKTDFDMPWKAQAEFYRADDLRVIETNESKLHYEEPQTTPDGSTIWLSTSKIPVHENGQVVAVLGMYEDVTAHKQAENAIHESEERFRRFAEATVEGLVFHEQGTIIDANPAGLAMFGFTDNAEFIGRNLLEFVAPEFHKAVLQNMQVDITHSHEIECIRKDGTIFPVENITRTYKEDGRVIRASSVRDITERKQAESELQREKIFSDAVINGLAGMFFLFDTQGKLVRWNEEYERVLGYTTSELAALNAMDPIADEDKERTVAAIERAFTEGQGSIESVVVTRDGRHIPFHFAAHRVQQGGQLYMAGTGLDITERKQAETEVQKSQQLLQSFLNNFPDAAWAKDLEGHFLIANRYLVENIYGTTHDQVIGKTVYDNFPKDVADFIWTSEKRLLETGEGIAVEENIPQADGQLYNKITTKFPLYDADGNINGLGGVLIDITERKRLEAQVQQAFDRRGYQVQVSTEISQEVAAATELSELFERVVTLTKERLGYYHTQLLRYDPAQDAVVLINGYGETGQKMLDAGHRMPMGSGLIGTAAATGETVMRSTLAEDPDWQPNPLLPETKGEIAVPIKWQDNVLGVLDVQSNQAGAFAEDDRLLLEGLCGQIAIAMHSAELVEIVRQNEARLAEALKVARLAHWEYDVEKDIFTFNDQFYSIFHTTVEKAGGYQLPSARYAELFVHPDDMEIVGAEIGKGLSSTERVYNTTIDHRILYADGGIGYMTVKVTVERDENGKITRYYGANQDITEQRKAQEEMAERLEEIKRLYRNMSHEGWKTYRETADLPTGFMFDQTGTRPVEEVALADENLASVPMKVLGGEVVGTLAVANDPRNPTSTEDIAFIQKVSDQIALALEGARLTAQTRSALAQSETLFQASSRLTQATDLQELVKTVAESMNIPVVNRAILDVFNYNAAGDLESMDVAATWWSGVGREPTRVGTHYSANELRIMKIFLTATPLFFDDALRDERFDQVALQIAKSLNLRSGAVLPLHSGSSQIGILFLQAEEPHAFTTEEIRLFGVLAPQIATVLENRRQFEQAQRQAEREAMLNSINQKIQSATSVEAVLQIAARELGHALGAPMTIAQLGLKSNGNGQNSNS